VNGVQRLHQCLRGFPLLCRSRSARRWKGMPIVSLVIVDTTPQLVSQRIHSVYVSHRIYDFLQRTFIQDMEPFVRSDLSKLDVVLVELFFHDLFEYSQNEDLRFS